MYVKALPTITVYLAIKIVMLTYCNTLVSMTAHYANRCSNKLIVSCSLH